jgi:outer membrane protein TolC
MLLVSCKGLKPAPDPPQESRWTGPGPIPGAEESRPRDGFPLQLADATAPTSATLRMAAVADGEFDGAMSLEEAINRALRLNRSLLDAGDRVDGSWFSIQAAAAEFELKVVPGATGGLGGGSGSSTRQNFGTCIELEKKFSTGTRVSAGPQVDWTSGIDENYRAGLGGSVTQPLLRGFSRDANLNSVKSAEFGWRSSQRALHLARVDTVLRSTAAVYEVVRQRELVRLNEESVARLELAVETAVAKERLGARDSVDRFRAEIELKQADDSLQAATQAYDDALDNLRILLDLPLDEPLAVNAPFSYSLIMLSSESAVELALDNRVELQQAADSIRETRRAVRVAKHNILPQLDLSLNYLRYGDKRSLDEDHEYNEDAWGASLTTSSDLMRTAERAAHAQSRIAVQASERAEDVQRDEIIRQVRRELRSLERGLKRIDNQTERIQQSRGQLAVARLKFERGLASNFDVIDAETTLRQSQTELLSAVLDYIVGTYRLRVAVGTLLPAPELVVPPSGRTGEPPSR